MIFSTEILGANVAKRFAALFLASTTALASGCGQKGSLFLAPQSVPYTLLPPAASLTSAPSATLASASAPVPAASASATR